MNILCILSPLTLLLAYTSAYSVPISDANDFRQACSGIWNSKNAEISVTFEPFSSGQAAVGEFVYQRLGYLIRPISQEFGSGMMLMHLENILLMLILQ